VSRMRSTASIAFFPNKMRHYHSKGELIGCGNSGGQLMEAREHREEESLFLPTTVAYSPHLTYFFHYHHHRRLQCASEFL